MSVNRLSSAHTDIIESLLNRSTRTASNYLSSFDESDNVEEGKNVSIDHMVFAIACLTTNQLTSVHEFGLHTRACEIKS